MKSNRFFPEIHGNFAFGCMRLPMNGAEVDLEQFCRMADAFIDSGFNYFDTAHGYISGKSELAIRECLAKRHGREEFLLTDKLTENYFESQEDIRPFLKKQLEWCGVDYFDFYLMHAQNAVNYLKYKECRAYETACECKQEGLIRHLGISFHDKANVLDQILTEHPEIEVVQIQFNYLDYDDAVIESGKVYETCVKHNKPVFVMEPVKGGNLVNLPQDLDKILRDLNGGSNASYALRYAASFDNIAAVLSGMSDMDQMQDNIDTMKDFVALSRKEFEVLKGIADAFRGKLIPCTSCKYCIEQNSCPMDIRIPYVFDALNSHETFNNWHSESYYKNMVVGSDHGKASDCIQCGACEMVCPQHLEIRELLKKAAEIFDK